MSNKTSSPKNTLSIETKLKKIDETLMEIRKEEGKLRMETERLIVKLESKIERLKVEREGKLERLKVERKKLNEKKKKLLAKEVTVLNREVKKRKINNQFGKGFTSPPRSTFIRKNNISNK
jgi:vacuolar-type H+-ATPase subunit I/STV1